MPERVEVPTSGPAFNRALTLARQGVLDGLLGGPGVEAGLEPVLTEAANDRSLGAALTYVLLGFAAQLAMVAAAAELDVELGEERAVDEEGLVERAVGIVEELAAAIGGVR